MELYIDTANLEDIARCAQSYPLAGVTCNPTILKAQGPVDFYGHLRQVRALAGPGRSLHVQVAGVTWQDMVADGAALAAGLGQERLFVKVLVNEAGLRAIAALKTQGLGVTATGVFTRAQGLLAAAAGADYLAPYCNRMAGLDMDFLGLVADLRALLDREGLKARILAASFRNMGQATDVLLAGAHGITLQPQILYDAMGLDLIQTTADGFTADWRAVRGEDTPATLPR